MSSTRLDITPLYSEAFSTVADVKVLVAANATAFYPGEPVVRALGAATCTVMATNKPVVATDYVVGIATSASTQTASVAGYAYVKPLSENQVWLIDANDSTAVDTQAEYDALVGDRVLMDLTAGKYTLLTTDGATYGCVIVPLDITEHPGKIAFTFRNGCSPLS
ncbi:MAG: hypothetical protein EOL95_09210 [Bacteroidia bacterium]|nr:hypothetical protein [Bacteroidia bacterium]